METQDNSVDAMELGYKNLYPVVYYSPGHGTTGRIYWPSTISAAPKCIVLRDGDSLQHAFLYISGV